MGHLLGSGAVKLWSEARRWRGRTGHAAKRAGRTVYFGRWKTRGPRSFTAATWSWERLSSQWFLRGTPIFTDVY